VTLNIALISIGGCRYEVAAVVVIVYYITATVVVIFNVPIVDGMDLKTNKGRVGSRCFFLQTRVARWIVFKPKITIWVKFGGSWNVKNVGIFHDHL
jgi:hypothetical protein